MTDTRGIVGPASLGTRFQLWRERPSPELAPFVAGLWIATWDLRDRPPHVQRVLPEPSVNVTVLTGEDRVVGVHRAMFRQRLEGVGRVTGVRFKPAGFRAFLDRPVSSITDRIQPIAAVFGPPATAMVAAVRAEPDPVAAVRTLEAFLAARAPEPDPLAAVAQAAVARIAADPTMTRVDILASDLGLGLRTLQRLFNGYVGVGVKWVIRRYRIREAADRAATGTPVNWALLAGELGYSDQAHFVRDFTRTIGLSPMRYARECGNPDW